MHNGHVVAWHTKTKAVLTYLRLLVHIDNHDSVQIPFVRDGLCLRPTPIDE